MDNPEEYAKNDFSININDILDEFEDEISKMKGKCLDIGCGPADVGRNLILPRLPSDAILVGIDASQKMIDYAQKKYGDEKRMIFKKLDIAMKDLPDKEVESYDNGISFFCLNCNHDQRTCFENIFKLLRPGGNCLVDSLVSEPTFPAYLRIAEYPQYKPYIKDASKMFTPLYFDKNPRATMKKMLQDIGFEVLHCNCREKTYIFKNKEEVKTLILSSNPYLNEIPENMKKDFINDTVREYLKHQLIYVHEKENYLEEKNIMIVYSIMILHIRKPE